MKLSAELAVRRIGAPQQLLQIVGISADQVGIEAPLAVGRKIPVVERERKFQLRRRLPAAGAASGEVQFIRRIGEIAFHFIPIERPVSRLGSFHPAREGGAAQRTREAPLPVEMAADDLRFRSHSTDAVNEIIVG